MRDFLGQKLNVDDFVVAGGGGNTTAEYGMVLYRIKKITPERINCKRLRVDYSWTDENGKRRKKCITTSKMSHASLSSPNKITKVTPHENQVKVFENPTKYPEVVGKWLHGAKSINWDKISLD